VSSDGSIPIKGAAVKIDDQQGLSDRNGKIRFFGLPFGQIYIQIQANGYSSYRDIIKIDEGENFYTFKLNEKSDKILISGLVKNGTNDQPVYNAKVQIGARSVKTDEEGRYSLKNINKGEINIIVSKNGFITSTLQRTCDKDTFIPIKLKPVFSEYSLSGNVIDRENKEPIQGATVLIDNIPIITDNNGHFFKQNLSIGIHKYSVNKPGYVSFSGNIMSSKEPMVLNIKLQKIAKFSSLSGVVCDLNGIPVSGAIISISGQKTISSGTGEFNFPKLRQGIYEIKCNADSYMPFSQKISLSSSFESQKITLKKKELLGKLNVIVRDRLTNFPLSKVFINIENLETTTHKNGEAELSYLSYGTHEIHIKASGFAPLNSKINISKPYSVCEFLLEPMLSKPEDNNPVSNIFKQQHVEFEDVKNIVKPEKIEKKQLLKNKSQNPVSEQTKPSIASIEGKIVSDKDDSPLKGVIISIGNKTAKSDEKGYYSMTIKYGDYEIMALADHFRIYRHMIHVSNPRVVFNMRLESNISYIDVHGSIKFTNEKHKMENIIIKLGEKSVHPDINGNFSFSMVKTDFYSIQVIDSGNIIYTDDILISEEKNNIHLEI